MLQSSILGKQGTQNTLEPLLNIARVLERDKIPRFIE